VTYILAADTGGTFTDLAVYQVETGRVSYTKSLTTYGDLVEGVMNCIAKVDVDLGTAEVVKFGTTLVINTFVQRNGVPTALVTTAGFRDVLEIGRGNRVVPFDLRHQRHAPLVPRDLRFEISERLSAQGEVIRALDVAELGRLASELKRLELKAVAVSLLNSYFDPRHEEAVVAYLRENLPGTYVSGSAELSREWGEYERTSTAVANAYVGPSIEDYVGRLEKRLEKMGLRHSFFLMGSNGGALSVSRACARPVMLVESGPAGGCIGASVYATELGLDKVIAFDMGGTTAKCALIEGGRFQVRSPYYVGGEEQGFPVRGGVLDIVEVGAGGGSVAYLDGLGGLHVGPRSAGSTPGPICYGIGGKEVTITDANLVLGRIDSASFLGGEMRLDKAAADAGMAELAQKLRMEGEDRIDRTAQGVLTLGAVTMASAIKRVSMERGVDPRDCTLVAFGGGGPLHTAALSRELGIRELIIPPEPGNFCALGMILADARTDEVRTFLRLLEEASLPEMNRAFDELESQMRAALTEELENAHLTFMRQADLRFRNQAYPLRVALEVGFHAAAIRDAFEATYQKRYGHVERGSPIQFVNVVLTASARIQRPQLEELRPCKTAARAGKAISQSSRQVYFAERRGRVKAAVFNRTQLPVGWRHEGAAIIEEYGSTTVVGPDDTCEVGRLGELRIRFNKARVQQ
jgi:N-methylhydantoinase A